jgi:hypothetical protein
MRSGRLSPGGLVVLVALIAIAALALTGGAAADDVNGDPPPSTSNVSVVVPAQADIDRLNDEGFDLVEYRRINPDGTLTVNIIATDDEIAQIKALGYEVAYTIEDEDTWRARLAERQAALDAEARSADFAEHGVPAGASVAKAGLRSLSAAPELVVQRAEYFDNYAGRFLSLEVWDSQITLVAGSNNQFTGPTLSVAWREAGGAYGSSSTVGRYIDTDPTPDAYMFNRTLIRLGPAGASSPTPAFIRVASSTGATVESPVSVWLGGGLPPHAAGYLSHFFNSYQDPTQNRAKIRALADEFPNISQIVRLPNLTVGYQRKSMGTFGPSTTTLGAASAAGATSIRVASQTGLSAGLQIVVDSGANQEIRTIATVVTPNPASPTPNITLTSPLTLAHANGATVYFGAIAIGNTPGTAAIPASVVLTATAYGQDGGNSTRAQFLNPGAPDAPLSVSTSASDVTVNLATNSAGNLTSTAAQVVAAINASPAAAALMSAQTWASNAGTGIVQPHVLTALSDFLAAPASVTRGPFQMEMLRIGKERDGSKVGIFLYCQQHAREWTTSLTCTETAEELLRNYAIDPHVRELVDNLDVFILPNVNPDGGHYSLYDFNSQRKNMPNYCAPGTTNSMPPARNSWGVDLNRNNTEYTLFDGYFGASTNCTGETYAGTAEMSEVEIKNEHWVVDTFSNIKFANNIHSYGGYFMWAPGSYTGNGRVTAPAPNIGVEGYFFAAADNILNRIKDYRGTAILPERTGPIADVLYSAAGNSADDMFYRKGIIGYSFETGADRFSVPTLSVASLAGATGVRFSSQTGLVPGQTVFVDDGFAKETATIATVITPNPASPAPNVTFTAPLTKDHPTGAHLTVQGLGTGTGQTEVGFFPNYANEGQHESMEFAAGNFGLLESALAYSNDSTAPTSTTLPGGPAASQTPIDVTFKWLSEPSIIHYTLDGSTPTMASPAWNRQGPRRPGEFFTFDHTTTVKWIATDIKGNTSAMQSARFAVETDAPTTTASLSPAAVGGYYRNPTVSLLADDDFDGGGAGIASTKYTLDAGAEQTYSAPFQVTGDGHHVLKFHSVDLAGNVEAEQTVEFDVDATPPVITITKPLAGDQYLLNSIQKANFGCVDALAGLFSCNGTVANGADLDTTSVGYKTFTVSASDVAGNSTTKSVQYNVHWPFSGFLPPLGRTNVYRAGSTIPVNFSLGGDRGLDIFAAGYPTSTPVSCTSPKALAKKIKVQKSKWAKHRTKRALAKPGAFSSLTYDATTQQYHINWVSETEWAGTCRLLVLGFRDNRVYTSFFQFR